jgi:hypothetical protein
MKPMSKSHVVVVCGCICPRAHFVAWQVREYWEYCGPVLEIDCFTFKDTNRCSGVVVSQDAQTFGRCFLYVLRHDPGRNFLPNQQVRLQTLHKIHVCYASIKYRQRSTRSMCVVHRSSTDNERSRFGMQC